MSQKHWRGSWCPPPFLFLTFFDIESFLKHRRVPWRNLSVLWNKIVLRRILIPLPPYAWKISEPDFFWNDEGFPKKCFDTVRQTILKTIVMPTHFLFLTFFQRKISETQKSSSTKCFGTVRWNHFDAQSWRPPPFLSLLFFDFKKIWNTERSLYEKFRYYETKKVGGESWCPPTFFSLTFFDIKKFLKHRRVHLRNVWVLWDKNFQRKIVKPLPLLCMKIFDCKISETQKGSPTKFFGTVSQINRRGS